MRLLTHTVGAALLAVLLAMTVAACIEAGDRLLDDRSVDTMTITWVTVDDPQLLSKACSNVLKDHGDYHGCAYWRGDRCTVWTSPVRGQMDTRAMTTLGHETLHCFRGAWH